MTNKLLLLCFILGGIYLGVRAREDFLNPVESTPQASIDADDPAEEPNGFPLLMKVTAISEDRSTFSLSSVDLWSETSGQSATYAWKDLNVYRADRTAISVEEAKKAVRVGQPIYWVDLPEKLDPTFREALADRTLIVSPKD